MMGATFETMGLRFGFIRLKRIERLTQQLKENKILKEKYQPE